MNAPSVERMRGRRRDTSTAPEGEPVPPHAGLSLKARALQWLAQREHSRLELRRKLLRRLRADEPQADDREARVDALLDWLAEERHLDERRFVESRVHLRAARFGNRRIESELKSMGVALDAQTAEQLRASEQARAQQVRGRRFGAPPADAAERARQARFLAGRGFSSEVIGRVLRRSDDLTSD